MAGLAKTGSWYNKGKACKGRATVKPPEPNKDMTDVRKTGFRGLPFKKALLAATLLAVCAITAFPQTGPQRRPVLGILPFTGGTGDDGNTVASLFSHRRELLEVFTVVPRTSALDSLFAEHYVQLSGMTDSDTIAGIGRLLNADYVLSGNIRRVGNRNLLIATIVNVQTFEQVAGEWLTYRTIREVPGFLSSMASGMVASTLRRETAGLPSLAIVPFALRAGISEEDAEALAQILAIEILRTESHVILPRVSTMQAALAEQDFQMTGLTADEGMASLGRAINADLVLGGEITGLGGINMFMAQILRVADGSMQVGTGREYRVIADGIDLMAEIALLLTDPAGAEERIAGLRRVRRRADLFGDSARFWSVGLSAGTSFAEPWAIGTLQATFAPFRYSLVRIGADVGFVSGMDDVGYLSVTPFAHYVFFLPFAALFPNPESGGWHIGAGGGLVIAEYQFDDFSIPRRTMAMDFTTGFNIGNMFDISYTLRTNFSSVNHKLSAGYTYRFQTRSR